MSNLHELLKVFYTQSTLISGASSEQGEQGQRLLPPTFGVGSSAPPEVCHCDMLNDGDEYLRMEVTSIRLFLLCTKLTKLLDFYDVAGVVLVALLLAA